MNSNENSLLELLDAVTVFEQRHELVDTFNFFEAVGMARQEIRHSRFLAFLLNPLAPHGLGEYFLRSLLDTVMKAADSPVMSRLDVMLADLKMAEVYTERDHFDITVWLPKQELLMVIENKVGASESNQQLSKYRERVQNQYPEKKFCGVFLTPDGYDGQDLDWIPIGYATIYDQLQALLHDPIVSVNADVSLAIKHYSHLIRKYIVVDKKLIEACQSIYAKHRTALNLIIEHGQISLLREASDRFLIATPELEIVSGGGNKRILLIVKEWKKISAFNVADTALWACECPLQLWFYADEKKSTLSLVLEMGPVREDTDFDREAFIIKLRNELRLSNKAISKTYTRIQRYDKSNVDLDDIDSIIKAMESLWASFGGRSKLEKIDSIIQMVSQKH